MRHRLSFELPILRPPVGDAFDTRPAGVEAWLQQLPLANLGEACRQLFIALYEVNRTQVSVVERLSFLERLAEPLAVVFPALQRHYVGQPFPPSDHARGVARLVTNILVELVIGYRLVIEGVRHTPWWRRWGSGPRKALAAHRILYYLGDILVDYQWQHLPYPRGVWRTVHRVFRHELKAGRTKSAVPMLPGLDGTASVYDEYKRLLLRTLVPLHRIRVEQWHLVEPMLNSWLELMHLKSVPGEYGFSIRLDADTPPTDIALAHAARASDRIAVMDTGALVQMLKQEPNSGLPLPLAPETVEVLCNAWGGARMRHKERQSCDGERLEVVLGGGALYRLLAERATTDIPRPLTLEHVPRDAEDLPKAKDVWEQAAPRKELQAKSWAEGVTATPSLLQATVLDHSETGYGVQLHAADVHALREGELIGLRPSATAPWEIGYLCWLRAESKGVVVCGIQYLAAEVLPVEVTVGLREGYSAPLGCLLGTTAANETALFLPYLNGVEEKELRLGYQGHETPVVLQERLDTSTEFIAYLFDVPEPSAASSFSAEVLAALRRKVQAPVAAAAEADKFGGLWQSL